jgi:hypothetical protein
MSSAKAQFVSTVVWFPLASTELSKPPALKPSTFPLPIAALEGAGQCRVCDRNHFALGDSGDQREAPHRGGHSMARTYCFFASKDTTVVS